MDGEMPVTVERPSIPTIPRRRAHHEVIDVDGLDDEQLDQRPSRRPRHPVPSDNNSSRDTMSPDIIIIDSDEPGPSTRRRPGVSILTLSDFGLS